MRLEHEGASARVADRLCDGGRGAIVEIQRGLGSAGGLDGSAVRLSLPRR